MSEPLSAASDGPNTHVYRDVRFVYEWTVVPLVDPDGVRHLFHVPTAILAAERAASERPPVDPLRELDAALSSLSEDDLMYDHPYSASGEPTDPVLHVNYERLRAALAEGAAAEYARLSDTGDTPEEPTDV